MDGRMRCCIQMRLMLLAYSSYPGCIPHHKAVLSTGAAAHVGGPDILQRARRLRTDGGFHQGPAARPRGASLLIVQRMMRLIDLMA